MILHLPFELLGGSSQALWFYNPFTPYPCKCSRRKDREITPPAEKKDPAKKHLYSSHPYTGTKARRESHCEDQHMVTDRAAGAHRCTSDCQPAACPVLLPVTGCRSPDPDPWEEPQRPPRGRYYSGGPSEREERAVALDSAGPVGRRSRYYGYFLSTIEATSPGWTRSPVELSSSRRSRA